MMAVLFRWDHKKAIAGLLAVFCLLTVLFLWGKEDDKAPLTGALPSCREGENEGQRQQFLSACGWKVSSEPVEILTVLIPDNFDEIYKEYNALQRSSGFDLTAHAGSLCRQYRYRLLDHPEEKTEAYVTLLVREGTVIGGDVFLPGKEQPLRPLLLASEGGNGKKNVVS